MMEAKLQAMEERILNKQNEKFSQVLALLTTGAQPDLERKVEKLSERIDDLMTGETESNKLLEKLPATTEKLDRMFDLLKEVDKQDEKYRKFYLDRLKAVMDEVISTKQHVKTVEDDTSKLLDRSRDSVKRSSRKSDHSSRKKRKRSSCSDRSRSSSGSVMSRDRGSIAASAKFSSKCGFDELEKLMVQLNESIGLLSEKVDKTNSCDVIVNKVVPQLHNVQQVSNTILNHMSSGASSAPTALPPISSMWDDDDSPSPLRKGAGGTGTPSALADNPMNKSDDRSSNKKHKKKRRRSRRADNSESSSSSEDEKSNKSIKLDSKEMKNNVVGFKLMDTRFTELSKTFKKNLAKVEESNKAVLKRVDQMASGIQIIAENVDSMNDLRKDLELLPKKFKSLDETLNGVAENLGDKIGDVRSLVDGSKGAPVTSGEYGQVVNLVNQVETSNKESLCEFGGLVETLQQSIVKRMEKIEVIIQDGGFGNKSDSSYIVTLLDISEKLIECVRNMETTQKKELLPKMISIEAVLNNRNDVDGKDVAGLLSPTTAGDLHHRFESKHQQGWDDMVTKVMPFLESLASRLRKIEDKEDNNKVEKILEIVEDIKDCKNVEQGVVDGKSNNFTQKLNDVFVVVNEIREEKRKSADMSRVQKLVENSAKTLEILMQNSNSDAKTLSGFNTTLQSMKTSMTGVNTTSSTLKDTLVSVDKKLGELVASYTTSETKLHTEIMSGFGGLHEEIKPYMDKLGSQNCTTVSDDGKMNLQFTKISDLIERLTSKVGKLENLLESNKVANNEINSKKDKNSSHNNSGEEKLSKRVDELNSKLSSEVSKLGTELKSQLDDVHDMVYSLEEKCVTPLDQVKSGLTSHDKTNMMALNSICKMVKVIQDDTKHLKQTVESKFSEGSSYGKIGSNLEEMKDTLVSLNQSVDAIQASANKTKVIKSDDNLNQVNTKLDKMSKVIGRVKFLVEKDTEDSQQQSKVINNIKTEPDQQNLDQLEQKMSKFQSAIEEELTNQYDMLTDLTNNFQELADKVSTKEALKAFTEDVKFRMMDIGNGMTELKSNTASSGGVDDSTKLRELEDNIAAAVTASLRDDIQKNFETINDTLDEMEAKLHGVKRLVSNRRGDDANEAGGSRLMERVEVVSRRLESVQAALEASGGVGGAAGQGGGGGFDTALLLEEIRKRAETDSLDRLSQDMFKSMHNVQQRLLEEHKRLISKISSQQEASPSVVQLMQSLNKVNSVQLDLLNKKSSSVTLQQETNRLLTSVVNTLESTISIISKENSSHMTRRMAELCEELSTSLNQLICIQKNMSQLGSLKEVDSLLRNAAVQFKNSVLMRAPGDNININREVSPTYSQGSHESLDGHQQQNFEGSAEAANGGEADLSDELLISPGKKSDGTAAVQQ